MTEPITTTIPPTFSPPPHPVTYESVEDRRLKSHIEIVRGLQMMMTGLGMVVAAYARLNGVKV